MNSVQHYSTYREIKSQLGWVPALDLGGNAFADAAQ